MRILKVEPITINDDTVYDLKVSDNYNYVLSNNLIAHNSGKGFVLKNLVGLEGKTLDVDHVKELAQQAPKIISKIKEQFGVDISKDNFPLKDPENVKKLHALLSDELGIVDKVKQTLYVSVLSAPKDRKPNIIFDVTMKNLKKFKEIAKDAKTLGYEPENTHMVWVINDVEVAKKQNQERSRTVPEEILMDTHVGAQQTMLDLLNDTKQFTGVVDGDIVFAFNKTGIDAEVVSGEKTTNHVTGKSTKPMYVKKANYIYVKRKGKTALSASELGKEWLEKISSYVPNSNGWKDILSRL